MAKVCKEDGEGTFARTRGNDKVAPIAVVPGSASRRHRHWRCATGLLTPASGRNREKGQVSEAVEFPQPDNRLVELFGAVDIANRQSDLPDVAEIQEHGRLLRS